MSAVSLPARLAYAMVALPLGGAAGFYSSMAVLPKLAVVQSQLTSDIDGYGVFKASVSVGAAVAFTAALYALTLPWRRHRKRSGRPARTVIAGVLVVVASAGFAAQGHALIYDLVFAGWLTYTMAFTFVRYGVLDQARRTRPNADAS